MEWLLDGATAIVLFGVLGFRWPLLAALVTEAVPGLSRPKPFRSRRSN